MFRTIAEACIKEMDQRYQEWRWIIRDAAKRHPLYQEKIKEGLYGETNSGEKIPINTLGRLLFGTPGFASCIRTIPPLNGEPGKVQLDTLRFMGLLQGSLGYDESEAQKLYNKAVELLSWAVEEVKRRFKDA